MSKKKQNKFASKVSKDKEKKAQSVNHIELPSDMEFFKETPGKGAQFDIVPYVVSDKKHPDRDDEYEIAIPGSEWYKRPYKTHRNVGANNEIIICLTTFGHKCPICEYRKQAYEEGADWDDVIKPLFPKKRDLYALIPHEMKDFEEKVYIWDISFHNFQKRLNIDVDVKDEFLGFPDPEDGYLLDVRFDEDQIGKKGKPYAKASRIDFYERDEQPGKNIVKEVPDLDKMLKVLSYKQIEAKFYETDEDEEDDDEESESEDSKADEKPKKQTTKRHTTRKNSGSKTQSKKKAEKGESKEEVGDEENKCPYGHRFGIDNAEYEDCDECEKFDECVDAS